MPSNLVKTKRDEQLWERAKRAVHKQYPKISEKDSKFWKLVVAIYLKMKQGKN